MIFIPYLLADYVHQDTEDGLPNAYLLLLLLLLLDV